jgi:hypothetical protein
MDQLALWADTPPAPTAPLVCPCCGTTSPNEFLADLNHGIGADGMCVSVRLRAAQARARARAAH